MKKILFFISLFIFVNPLFSIVFVPAVQTYQCQNKPLVYSHTVNPYCGTTECYAYDSSNPVFTSGQAHCVSDTLVAVQKLVKNNNVSPWPSYPYCACNVTEYYYAVTSCPTGQVVVDGICKAPQCPSGKILDASGKYCVPQTCPIGSTRDPHTLHCLPTKCPEGQTLISDGTCQTSCPPNSSRVDKICRYDCGHWDKATCGKYLDSQGNACKWSYGSLWSMTYSNGSLGSCVTASKADQDILDSLPLQGGAKRLPDILGEPALPEYEPQPLKPYEPAKPVIPKPINDPDYIPPVTPTPIEPIPVKPVEPEPLPSKPANDPDYVPTIDPVTPLTPDIVPYVPPVPAPAPVPEPAPAPLPAPVPLPAPAPTPAPTPAPSPSPLPSPTPAPSPSPAPLPMPKPDYTYDPVPETPPVIDPVPAPAPSTVPDVNMPNVNMPPIPDILDFSIDDMDKFRYNATTMSYNILDQVDNVQNTFTNTMNILNNGFPPVVLPSGSCGSSMSFGFYGKEIDLCPPLANTSAQFAPLFQLLIFLVGLIASIKIFMIGLRD